MTPPATPDVFLTVDSWADLQSDWKEGQIAGDVYQLLEKYQGGMGEVWKARDTQEQRFVAIKRIGTHLQGDPDAKRRFEREMRILQEIQHPHIVPIYAVHPEGTIFIMPWLEGRTLRQALEQEKRLSLLAALRLFCEITDALHCSHEKGIIHRDLKPENIFLEEASDSFERWRAKLLDFGIAADLQATRQTTRMIGGTAYYMAPEQHEATASTTAASDIYALGQIFYECLTGSRPVAARLPKITEQYEKLEKKAEIAPSEYTSSLRSLIFEILAEIDALHDEMIAYDAEGRCSLDALQSRLQGWYKRLQEARLQDAEAIHQRLQELLESQQYDSLWSLLRDAARAYPEYTPLQAFLQQLQSTASHAEQLASELQGCDLEEQSQRWTAETTKAAYPFLFQQHPFATALQEAQEILRKALQKNKRLLHLEGCAAALEDWLAQPQQAKAWREHREHLLHLANQQKSLPELLAQLDTEEPDLAKQTLQAIHALGLPCLPALLPTLQQGSNAQKRHLCRLFEEFLPHAQPALQQQCFSALLIALQDPSEELKIAALKPLALLPQSTSQETKEILFRCLETSSDALRDAILQTAQSLHIDLVPEMIALLQRDEMSERFFGASLLARFSAKAAPALDSLLSLLRDPVADVACAAAAALTALAPHLSEEKRAQTILHILQTIADAEFPLLPQFPSVDEKDNLIFPPPPHPAHGWSPVDTERLRQSLLSCLVSFGNQGFSLLAKHGIESLSLASREAAILALIQIDKDAAFSLFLERLESDLWFTREAVIFGLALLAQSHAVPLYQATQAVAVWTREGAESALAWSVMLQSLDLSDPVMQKEAAAACSSLGRDALLPLRHALRDASPIRRAAAAQTLSAIGPLVCESIPMLLLALHDSDASVVEAALSALAAMKQTALATLPTIHRLCQRDDLSPTTRLLAHRAAQSIKTAPPLAEEEVKPLWRIFEIYRSRRRENIQAFVTALSLLRADADANQSPQDAYRSTENFTNDDRNTLFLSSNHPERYDGSLKVRAMLGTFVAFPTLDKSVFDLCPKETQRIILQNMIENIYDYEVRAFFEELGSVSIPYLVPALESEDWEIRKIALEIISCLGSDGSTLLMKLRHIVENDTDDDVVYSAREAIRNIEEALKKHNTTKRRKK